MSVVHVFGPVTVHEGTRTASGSDFGGCRPRVVLALLAMAPGSPLGRDEIAEALWEGRPPRGYVATLHGYVCLLRRALVAIGAGDALVTTAHGYLLAEHRVSVDLHRGHEMLASGEPDAVLDALDMAAHGLLVDEPYAAWAAQARTDWDEAVARAATRAAGVARLRGETGSAVRLARAALRASPYCETALRELMTALIASGEPGRAVQAYEDARERLETDLGVALGAETEQLYLDLLRPRAARPVSAVPELIRLLRDALEQQPLVDVDDPVVRDVRRLLVDRVG